MIGVINPELFNQNENPNKEKMHASDIFGKLSQNFPCNIHHNNHNNHNHHNHQNQKEILTVPKTDVDNIKKS